MGRFARDITGRRFGKLTARRRLPSVRRPSGSTYVPWESLCDCGRTVVIRTQHLVDHVNLHCGECDPYVETIPGGRSYRSIAAELGVSAESVRQIERIALTKLRVALESQGFSLQDLLQTTPKERIC
jgi:hypothetical protein